MLKYDMEMRDLNPDQNTLHLPQPRHGLFEIERKLNFSALKMNT